LLHAVENKLLQLLNISSFSLQGLIIIYINIARGSTIYIGSEFCRSTELVIVLLYIFLLHKTISRDTKDFINLS
jgi:hypothetical protein